jgi:hypothetical protein
VRAFYNPYKQGEIWVSSFGNGMMVGSNQPTDIKNEVAANKNELKVFPNPAAGTIYFMTVLVEKGTLTVFDITGKEITKTEFAGQSWLDVSSWQSGMYFYQAHCGTKLFAGKFVVNK